MNSYRYKREKIVKITSVVFVLGALASCGDLDDSEGSSVVRDFGWVKSLQSVSVEYGNGSSIEQSCVVTDGSKIYVDSQNIATIVGNEISSMPDSGTACPEGTKFNMTPKMYATLDDAIASQEKFEINVSEANRISNNDGEPVGLNGWFVTVNKPSQTYRSISSADGTFGTKMDLGEKCLVKTGTPVRLLGRLSTGDYAAIVDTKKDLGTPCPEGAIIIIPSSDIPR